MEIKNEQLLRLPQVETTTGLKKSSIYRLVQEKKFPAPIRLSVRSVAWPSSQIQDWISRRIAAGAIK